MDDGIMVLMADMAVLLVMIVVFIEIVAGLRPEGAVFGNFSDFVFDRGQGPVSVVSFVWHFLLFTFCLDIKGRDAVAKFMGCVVILCSVYFELNTNRNLDMHHKCTILTYMCEHPHRATLLHCRTHPFSMPMSSMRFLTR